MGKRERGELAVQRGRAVLTARGSAGRWQESGKCAGRLPGCPRRSSSFVERVNDHPPAILITMATNSSPFLLIFRDSTPERYSALSAEQRQRLLQQWNSWYDGLAEQGKVQHGHPLEAESRVVSGSRGERVVDGPFAEAKEAVGGYFLLTVSDIDEATEIAKQCPSLDLGISVEVRPVAEYCEALGVRGRPAQKQAVTA